MQRVYYDYETRSGLDISEVGRQRYLHDEHADIVMLAYQYGDEPVRLWFPGDPLLPHMTNPEDYLHYAHHIQFDAAVTEILGKKYGILPVPLDNQVDTMALCGRYTFPQRLKDAAIATGAVVHKTAGDALMAKICSPPFKYTHAEFKAFCEYCRNDVYTMRAILDRLPLQRLSAYEHEVWKLTCKINRAGLPINLMDATIIRQRVHEFREFGLDRLRVLTSGKITSIGQLARILKLLKEEYNLILPNLQAITIEETLELEDIHPIAREILELRQDLGPAAVKKFDFLCAAVVNGRIYDNLAYYVGHTGRWGGRGFQLQNLPRAKSKRPDALLEKFYDGSIIQEPVIKEARKLVRHMIMAPEGKLLRVVDYKGIENRLLLWFSGELDTLEFIGAGGDLYVEMAKFLYQKEGISDDERFMGKVIELGCGYGMGHKKFRMTAKGFGLLLTEDEAQRAVAAYRRKHPLTPKMWYACHGAACNSIRFPGRIFESNRCTFQCMHDGIRVWMKLTLPNGNGMYYAEPQLEGDPDRPQLSYLGINAYTNKWDRKYVTPGLLTENIIQGCAREYMAEGALELARTGAEIVGLVHDESIDLIDEIPESQWSSALADASRHLCYRRPWAEGLPMATSGYIAKRYKKD